MSHKPNKNKRFHNKKNMDDVNKLDDMPWLPFGLSKNDLKMVDAQNKKEEAKHKPLNFGLSPMDLDAVRR